MSENQQPSVGDLSKKNVLKRRLRAASKRDPVLQAYRAQFYEQNGTHPEEWVDTLTLRVLLLMSDRHTKVSEDLEQCVHYIPTSVIRSALNNTTKD